jgi:hypothetical protein
MEACFHFFLCSLCFIVGDIKSINGSAWVCDLNKESNIKDISDLNKEDAQEDELEHNNFKWVW